MVYKGVEGIVDMLQWAAAAPTNNIVRIFYDSMTRDERERLHAIATSAIRDVGKRKLTEREAYTTILNSSEPLKQILILYNLYGMRNDKWIFLNGSKDFIDTLRELLMHPPIPIEVPEEYERAPSYGMANCGSTCWFDSFVFMMLADPSNQFPACLEESDTQLARDLLRVRRFMYEGGGDPNTGDIINMLPTTNVEGHDVTVRCGRQEVACHAALIIETLLGCGVTVLETNDAAEELGQTRLLAVAREEEEKKIVPDAFVPYGQVFYFGKDNRGHYTALLECINGVLYYDDVATPKIRFFKDEVACRRTFKKPTRTYDFYFRNGTVVDGESKGESKSSPAGEAKHDPIRREFPGWVYSYEDGRPFRRYDAGETVVDGYPFGPHETYDKLQIVMGQSLNQIIADVANTSGLDDKNALQNAVVDAYGYIIGALEEHAKDPIDCIDEILEMTTKSRMLWNCVQEQRLKERRLASTGTRPGVYDGSTRYSHNSCPAFQHAVIYDMHANPVYVGDVSLHPPTLDRKQVYRIFHSQNINSFERLQFVTQHACADALPRMANIFHIAGSSAPPDTDYAKRFIATRVSHVLNVRDLTIRGIDLTQAQYDTLKTIHADLKPLGDMAAAHITLELIDDLRDAEYKGRK